MEYINIYIDMERYYNKIVILRKVHFYQKTNKIKYMNEYIYM